ncbi:hypothetical protein CFP71_14755 [Amycolatopsis thailandensis]|uniref:Uncharacterized protein n=1 Tax=Amycolatopsis thailandensis TaxID=589330 RepID=A0A229SBK7_9PSEU|nr:hypothetical protein [Amycolatopsis thailandensis]OXM56089.1 hypothetical protein CFP71_14755 [Amycolatopsis thailandensis]
MTTTSVVLPVSRASAQPCRSFHTRAIDPDHGIDAGGGALLDVKTVVSVRDTGRVGRWPWQVLLYTWLDTADLYRIRRVGFLFGRHGPAGTRGPALYRV